MLRALICGAFHPNPYVFDVWPTKVCFIGHVCVCASAQKTNEKITRCSWLTFVTVIVRFHLYLLGMQRNFGSWKLLAENCIFGFWPKEWKQCSVSSFHSPSSCCQCAVWRSSQCSLIVHFVEMFTRLTSQLTLLEYCSCSLDKQSLFK